MSENYIEIQVNIYVDKSVVLKNRFSEDAKVINVRDSIGLNDEFLFQRNAFAFKRQHTENKPTRHYQNNHRPNSLCQTEKPHDIKRTPIRKHSCEASVVCHKSEAKSNKSTANKDRFKDKRDDRASPFIFSPENLNLVRHGDNSAILDINPVKFASNANFENETSFISHSNLVGNDFEKNPAFDSSDYDESSSGIYTDDENCDTLDRIQCAEVIEGKISYSYTGFNEKITEGDFSKTNNFLIKDVGRIESEIDIRNVNVLEVCRDLLNEILDRIEIQDNCQRLDKCQYSFNTDIKKCTHETVTGGTVCCHQGIEYTTDMPNHDYSSNIDTKYCSVSSQPTTKLEIKTLKIKSSTMVTVEDHLSSSFSALKTNMDRHSCFAEAKTANEISQNITPTEKIKTDLAENCTTHADKYAAKPEQTFRESLNTASEESLSEKMHTNVDESTPDDLEPGEIPDETEISTKTHFRVSPKYHHKEKHSSLKYYNLRYFNNRPTIKNMRLFSARSFNRDLKNLRFQRISCLPRRELKTKRIIYNWSDYTEGNDSLQTDDVNRSPIHRHDLRNRIEANDHREYIGYEQRLHPSYGSTYGGSRKTLRPRLLYHREHERRKPSPLRSRYQTERYQETEDYRGNSSHDVYQSHRNENSFLYDFNREKIDNNFRGEGNTPNRSEEKYSRSRYRRSSYDRRETTDGREHKYTNFKITRRFSSGDEISRHERSNISTGSIRSAPLKKDHRAQSETAESGHEERAKGAHKIKWSRQSSNEHKPRFSKRSRETCTRCESKESREDKSNACTEDKVTSQYKSHIGSSRCHKTKISPNENEQKLTSVVTFVSSSILDSTDTSSNTAIDNNHLEEKRQLCVIKDNQAHLKCFEIIRDIAFKKAVHHSDANWDKYSKRKFVFEDELIQQLERNYNRYLYLANDMKLQSKATGPLPRFASDDLMTKAIVDTWKQPQIIASCDRQYREFDDIIGYVGYNIPCYWCEMVFADGMFVCAFPVLDPIGHRDDTMYCQDDQ